ncbi:MAG: protein translocase subunit SecD [Bacilli bacterium]|nr:protein translocase subunit SecD [Bacilli bacterium]
MKNKQHKIARLMILVILIVAVIGYITPTLFNNLKFGLDLKGGFEVLYQVESVENDELTSDMVTSTYKTMLKRIDVLGVSEPVITIEGSDRIRVQLAGVTDADTARKILSQAANLTFRDTKDNLLMTSEVLTSGGASVGQDSKGLPAVSLSVSDKEKFYKVTKAVSKQDDNRIVIWLDFDETTDSYESEKAKCGSSSSSCLSVATVSQGFASDVIIQGKFTTEEVSDLVELINSGSLPTKLTEISSKTVDASFGVNSLNKTLKAGVIAIAIIMILMIALYRFAGFIASVGIVIYTFLTFAFFWLVGGVLTLPGIAATVLGIGMAVDANIINFARIKDELEAGRDFKSAYKKGNSNSLLTIIDANVTTLLVAVILFILGESSVKGFATMLIINIFVTVIVMVVITRLLLNAFVKTGYFDNKLNLFLGIKKLNNNRFSKLGFVKSSKYFIGASILIIIIGFISLGLSGLNLGVDFKGGSSITIKSENELNINDIKTDIETLKYDLTSIDAIDDNTIDLQIENNLTQDEINKTTTYFEEKYEASTDIGVISNIVKKELVKNAILSVILASIGIIIYMSIRYKLSYAIGGVVALFHDAIMIIVLFSLFKLEVSTIFIAAILTIIGYSINDTIVIFDRIKETIKEKYNNKITKKEQLVDAVNYSLRLTLTRSIITTLATLIPVILLITMGSYEILNFNIALLFGLVAGAYSSIFIASQIWLAIETKNIGKTKKKKWYEESDIEEKKVKGINS